MKQNVFRTNIFNATRTPMRPLFCYYFLLLLTACNIPVSAQQVPIGQWRSFLPYNRAVCAATSGSKLFVAGQSSFFTYDILNKEITTYSKVNGMSDVELAYTAYDPLNDMAILAYTNSNIDLFRNETFYNIPELKLRSISGDKSIYHIYVQDGMAYLSTGIGILVINLGKKEIKETYAFNQGKKTYAARGVSANFDYLYAVTDNGIYRTKKNNPNIQATASWSLIDSSRKYIHTTTALNKTFFATVDSVFVLQSDTPAFVYTLDSNIIRHIDPVENGLCIATYSEYRGFGELFTLDNAYKATDSFETASPMQVTQTSDGTVWVADISWGLRSRNATIIPNSPTEVGVYDILPDNGKLYIAHGARDDRWNIKVSPAGISIFENDKWSTYNRFNFSPFDDLRDAVALGKDPKDNTLYIASLMNGLFYIKENRKEGGNIKEGVFEQHLVDPSTYRLSSVVFDSDNNMWVTQNNSPNELVVRSAKDGGWYKYALPAARTISDNGAAGLIIDDFNQKWFFSPAGGGVMVYDDNHTPENGSDDRYAHLQAGVGAGNLPENFVACIANDKKGAIWIGTSNGIGIVNCPDRVIDNQCEAEIRVVQYDQFAGQLFAGENVKTIAVDGANRKWVGTGNGAWLISEDANKVVTRFTVDNSPLPSNSIQVIRIDPLTGDVYFGTDKGLVSYRGSATDGGASNKDVLVFPNPVKSNYTGTIAIKGLVENADVRITDISGQLIYRTKAQGGQAIWNGMDYKGRRPQTGVFLVFATNKDGTETFAGKMVFVR